MKKTVSSQWTRRFLKIKDDLASQYVGNSDSINELAGAITYFDRINNKSNTLPPRVLIGGPTSSGKSYLAELSCKSLGCGHSIMNMAIVAPESYKGSTMTDALQSVARMGSTKKSIIVLDEVDKIAKRAKLESSFKSIEYSMLSILNGDPIHISDPSYDAPLEFNTRRSMIMGMGVFDGISPADWENHDRIKQSLVKMGYSPEWVSRWTHFIYLKKIATNELYNLVQAEVKKIGSVYESGESLAISPTQIRKIMNSKSMKSFGLRSSRSMIHKEIFRTLTSDINAY